ncbi:hypothetical protein PMAYCL1PPCAC_22869, partial [Pristionchus mayeri]
FSGFWIFLPPVIVATTLYLLYAKFYSFAPCVLMYVAWYYYSREWPESGCMKLDFFRKNPFARAIMRCSSDYFSYKIVKTAELPADRNYIVGSHPHGVACIGLGLSYGSNPSAAEYYEGCKGWGVTLAGQFLWPFRRECLMLAGVGIASRRFFEWLFGQDEKGQVAIVVIGGLNEAIITSPGKYYIKLLDRKGFVRVALEEGADLVPAFTFGENETYRTVTGICPKRLRNMQAHLINTFGFAHPFPIGRSMLGLPWGGLVPIKTRMVTVIGGPIRVEKSPNPTQEQVDHLHGEYCQKLIDLFESHKENYRIRPDQRIILY